MATQLKNEKSKLRQTAPAHPQEAVTQLQPAEAAPQPAEPIAQFEATPGDRVAYALWLICTGVLMLHFLCDTIFGLLF